MYHGGYFENEASTRNMQQVSNIKIFYLAMAKIQTDFVIFSEVLLQVQVLKILLLLRIWYCPYGTCAHVAGVQHCSKNCLSDHRTGGSFHNRLEGHYFVTVLYGTCTSRDLDFSNKHFENLVEILRASQMNSTGTCIQVPGTRTQRA